jgi:hypothetical protein
MTGHVRLARFGILLTAALGAAVALADGGGGHGPAIIRAGMATKACQTCHTSEKDRSKLADAARSCDNNCLRCHKDMEKHHSVGSEVKEQVPLPLLGTRKLACVTCHDVNAPTTDTKSWKSQSLYARLFQGQAVYKTYLLRINNSSGKLCQTCH